MRHIWQNRLAVEQTHGQDSVVLTRVRPTLSMVRQELSRSQTEMGVIAEQVLKTPPHEAIRNKLSKFKDAKDNKEISSIMSSAQTQTRFLDSPGIARNLAAEGLDFERLKTETITVYLVLPPERLVTHANRPKFYRLAGGLSERLRRG